MNPTKPKLRASAKGRTGLGRLLMGAALAMGLGGALAQVGQRPLQVGDERLERRHRLVVLSHGTGGWPVPGFNARQRDEAHDRIVAFHRQHLPLP